VIGPEQLLATLAPSVLLSGPWLDALLAYGPVPGVELIPYFLGLLAWVALAIGSILLSPLSALLRRLRRGKSAPPAEPESHSLTAPEPAREGRHDTV
jgi:hypothetical protein